MLPSCLFSNDSPDLIITLIPECYLYGEGEERVSMNGDILLIADDNADGSISYIGSSKSRYDVLIWILWGFGRRRVSKFIVDKIWLQDRDTSLRYNHRGYVSTLSWNQMQRLAGSCVPALSKCHHSAGEIESTPIAYIYTLYIVHVTHA